MRRGSGTNWVWLAALGVAGVSLYYWYKKSGSPKLLPGLGETGGRAALRRRRVIDAEFTVQQPEPPLAEIRAHGSPVVPDQPIPGVSAGDAEEAPSYDDPNDEFTGEQEF